ncbi:hypothetical protein Fcan01_05398 [Folsomia candida]|uniref:Uncharacterized protein n=1 Tax=Folsomia candida TaxID=158441 RepID=A0A226ERV2_FOLCA|nr:hypothetical protein Fcan01_05398 [Folsomia candida]
MGMQLADIKSLDDYKSINEYMLKKYPDCQKYQHVWLIGSSQKPGDTWWWDSDLESTKFQMFLAFEPFKGKIPVDPKWDRDYVVLMCVTKDDDMQGPTYGHAYRDTPHGWRYNLGIICQFHADTECYTNSRETQQNEKHEDKLWKLGETKKRKYWAGSGQKRFEDAEIHCKEGEEHPMHLLDLEITEPEEAKELYKLMSEFIKKHGKYFP